MFNGKKSNLKLRCKLTNSAATNWLVLEKLKHKIIEIKVNHFHGQNKVVDG